MYAALTFFGQGTLICKSSSVTDEGKTVSVTDGKRTWSGALTNGVCVFKTLPAKQKYTVCLLNGDDVEYATEVIFGFGECHEIEVGLDKTTWKGLKAIVNAGLETEMLAVGDRISATVNGEEQNFVIAHIDYRKGVYGNNIILAKTSCLVTPRVMHSGNTNMGGYGASELAPYLDNDYYNDLPADLRSVITEMEYLSCGGTIGAQPVITEKHKIWLPLEWNVFGEFRYAGFNEYEIVGAEQFSYFVSGNRAKTLGDGGASTKWWASSPAYVANTNNGKTYCAISEVGEPANLGSNNVMGVLPCFMIAADK